MSGRDQFEALPAQADASTESDSTALLHALVENPVRTGREAPSEVPQKTGIVIGQLLAIADDGGTPLVIYPGQTGAAALRARTAVDLHGAHIGKSIVLMFESADPMRPIVMGVLRESAGWPLDERPGQVQVDADGERLLVSAKEQLVLRCGKASITLTRAGKVLIQGEYVSSRSSGVNRIKGGSVQLN